MMPCLIVSFPLLINSDSVSPLAITMGLGLSKPQFQSRCIGINLADALEMATYFSRAFPHNAWSLLMPSPASVVYRRKYFASPSGTSIVTGSWPPRRGGEV